MLKIRELLSAQVVFEKTKVKATLVVSHRRHSRRLSSAATISGPAHSFSLKPGSVSVETNGLSLLCRYL